MTGPTLNARLRSLLGRSRAEAAYAVAWKLGFRHAAPTATHRAIFGRIHETNGWGEGESVSGPGSTVAKGQDLRGPLLDLFARYGVSSLVDAPCGDFNWMRIVSPGVLDSYAGIDIVAPLIERNNALYGSSSHRFECADLSCDPLPRADLLLCRDVFIHFSFADIWRAIANFRASGSTYLLATTFVEVDRNDDTRTGGWRPLNLQARPFNFPEPLETIPDTPHAGFSGGKCLSLWRLANVPEGPFR